MNASHIADSLEKFLQDHYGIDPHDPGFGRTIDLMESGYVDSIAVVEVLAFIGDEFHVEIPDDDLMSDTFTSINGMAEVIERLTASAARDREAVQS